jgi:hypothetical protein
MRVGVAVVTVLAALAAVGAAAAPTPTYTVTFQGAGSEHQVDLKQNIQDDGTCDAAEHVDVTAAVSWSVSWARVRVASRSALGAPARVDGSRIAGSHIKDACGRPLDEAPAGWVSQSACDDALVTADAPQFSAVPRGRSIVLAVAAPAFAVPVSAKCPLNVRNDQLGAHAVVQVKRLEALKRGQSISLPVGTSSPGPGDAYAPDVDCSVPTKPYEGYRTADHCEDKLSWSGALKITRAS